MFENYHFLDGMSSDQDILAMVPGDDDSDDSDLIAYPNELPILALKNTVLFPGITIPITVGRDKSIQAVKKAYEDDRLIAVVSQRNINEENPGYDDLYHTGTIARIIKLLKMPDGTNTIILQGKSRFALQQITQVDPYLEGIITPLTYIPPENELEFDATVSSIRDLATQIIRLSPNIPSEAVVMLNNITNSKFLLEFISSNLAINVEEKQKILELGHLQQKAHIILEHMNSELQLLELKDQIETKVRGDIEKQQRDYFLNQQLKTIQEELGQNPLQDEINELAKRARKKKWPNEAKEIFDKELNKLQRINPQMAEYSVVMNYLDLLLDLPWNEFTKDNFNLQSVKKVLDKDHFGLQKVKERIIEHLAVLKLKGDMKAPILCLVGPPGVGKTSLGKSVAKALKRKFVRMSLGGLHDESEIRGHRKTYIGAMPGRIIQSLKKSGSSNPVFILDEIDKVGKDFRGDPSSALLEVLDPEQNNAFHDNYLELEYDLSKVLFIATANNLSTIQPALRDRMEIIQISGYSEEEKLEIAKRHLIPKLREDHGLKAKNISINKRSLQKIIAKYTRESGVRNLNRQIASVMRYAAKEIAMGNQERVQVKHNQLVDILGPSRFSRDVYDQSKVSGVAVGLAWTSVGGDILFVEASLSPGKGKITLTGNLGDVMKESATTALSYIKAHSEQLGITKEQFETTDIHVHVPEGAIPKDGPSAGVTMLTAISSAFTDRKVKPYVAMTGEITLRGKVLPVGGIKEKVLAAKRAGIKEIILCHENEKNVAQIEDEYIKDVEFIYVRNMEEVLNYALI